MGKIIIEALGPIPQRTASEIRGLVVSKDHHVSVKPRMEGNTVVCGYLAWPAVSKRLEKAGVSHIVSREPKSRWDKLPRVIYRYEPPPELTGRDDDLNVPLPPTEVIFQRLEESPPERTYSSEELIYFEKLNMLEENRALPLDAALSAIASNVNVMLELGIIKTRTKMQLHPWHLVEFKPSGSGNLQTCLTRLNGVSGPLTKCTWDLVHAFEEDDDKNILEAEAAFDDTLDEVLYDSRVLRGFYNLALKARQEQSPSTPL